MPWIDDYEIIKKISRICNSLGVEVYLVGGAVRDLLLGINPVDFDFSCVVSEEKHREVTEKLSQALSCELIYNSHYCTGKLLCEWDVDFVMARDEVYKKAASVPEIKSSTIFDDLKRRDFSINSIAVSLQNKTYGDIIDPFQGVEDLKKKKIRVLHNQSFRDDPTRIFRGIKYASRFGFEFDEKTRCLICNAVENGFINHLSGERIKQELISLLNEKNLRAAIKFVDEFKILDSVTGCSVSINLDISQDIFKELKDNEKFAAILFDNNEGFLIEIQKKLSLGMEFLNYSGKLNGLKNCLQEKDEVLYRYILKNLKGVNKKLIEAVFQREPRVGVFLENIDKIKIDIKDIMKIAEAQRDEFILNKKIESLIILSKGGKNGFI
ncbi:hypothetical protein Q428_11490 [Fervidicella metallireducens AeB]|uniref:Poly A polymerase head domain-containing protein n=1 Tax=Fervidicella metallireducens AeB TaxID=1403537 RepID=A0A017RV40_9CLOT|nr:CCA tRNA nucleotidyltransferase [Fervidicella metallireducens]EYE87780.1 hypothetical protein Q428_11490 [Fervidicella metallireducens AeB]